MIKSLSEYLQCPVVLSDQTQPEPAEPFVFYSILSDYQPINEVGNYTFNQDTGVETRGENPTLTLSFTAISRNRYEGDAYIYGENEAMDLCDRMQGFFLHSGKDQIHASGFVLVNISNSGSRSALEIDEMSRQYGFDVQLRYYRIDDRSVGNIDLIVIIRK